MFKALSYINEFVWGIPALVLILGVGLYLSLSTGFAQLRLFPEALRLFCRKMRVDDTQDGSVSGFQALCTALAATVGTGNIAGVAGAISIGGPGSIFWMWVCALLGMITKYAEATLAVHFRYKDEKGNFIGGPMYMIRNGMGLQWRWLGSLYCLFGIIAAFGVGNATQINAVTSGVNSILPLLGFQKTITGNLIVGVIVAGVLSAVLLGGAARIGSFTEALVPFASVVYILMCLGALINHCASIPNAFAAIVTGAFSPRAVTGGVLGSAFIALRVGISRGVFTNEAGMGTASIAHAAAQVRHPAEQGLMGIIEVFLDTVVICTMTALVILSSGTYIPYGVDEGVTLTVRAFACTYGEWIGVPLTLFLCLFAFATMLGWGLYGMRCAQYLFGTHVWKSFVWLQSAVIVTSTLLQTHTVWLFSETVNGLMAIPNLIALTSLSPVLIHLTKEYILNLRGIAAFGGTYESFYQCKQMRAVTDAEISSTGGGSGKKRKNDISFEYWTAGSGNSKGVL